MKKEFTELERLNFAARAEVAKSLAPIRLSLVCIAAMVLIVITMPPHVSSFRVAALRVVAAVGVLAGLAGLLRWRYGWHTLAAFYFAVAAVKLFGLGSRDLDSFWMDRLAIGLGYIAVGYSFLVRYAGVELAVPLAVSRDKEWKARRARVQEWLKELVNQAAEEQVFEASTGSFWTGYFTYRFMRREGLWIVGRFKKANYFRLQDYRVLGPGAITIAPSSDGKLSINFGKRTLALDISPDMRGSLLRATV